MGGIRSRPPVSGSKTADGRSNSWYDTAEAGAQQALKYWVKVEAHMAESAYTVSRALGNLPDPVWPAQTFGELLDVAFRDKYIQDMSHPAIQRVLGMV